MVKNLSIPERGDIVWVDFSPTKGHEQSGLRPAVVVSPFEYNSMFKFAIVCPMTTRSKKYAFGIPVQGPQRPSFVLADQVRSIDIRERIVKKTGKINETEMNEILARALVLFE